MVEYYKHFGDYKRSFTEDRPNPYANTQKQNIESMVMAGLERKLQALTQKRNEKQQLEEMLRRKDAEILALHQELAQSSSRGGAYGPY